MEQVYEVIKKNIQFCVPQTRTPDMLYLMKKYDYDDLLVFNNMYDLKLVGIVHHSSLNDEALEKIPHPFDVKAEVCMDRNVKSVSENSSLEECASIMEEAQLNFLPVVNQKQACVGIILLKDIK